METEVEEAPKPARAALHHAPTRPKGRPKKDSIPPEAATAKPFPNPPRALLKGGIVSPEKFMDYRRTLGGEFLERITFYVNREWPKLDFYQHFTEKEMEEIRQKKRAKPVKYVGQYADINPDNWRDEILRYHGSGDYKIYLNDTGVRGNPSLKSRNICKTVVSIRDDEFPPVMDEHLHVLDWKDPINNSFIQQLRGKGVVPPGETPNKKEETDDMATNVAVETLAELAKQGSKPHAPAADNTAIFQEMLRQSEERHRQDRELDAQRHQREIEALTKRLDSAEKSGGNDNLATTRAVIEMAKSVIPVVPVAPQNDRMHDILLEMVRSGEARHLEELKLSESRHAREMEALNKRLDAEASARVAAENARLAQTQQPAGKNAIQDAIALVKALKGATEEINGDSAGGPQTWVELVSQHLPRVLDTVGNVITAVKPPVQGASALAPSDPQQPQQQPQQRQEPTEMDQRATYARMIEPHLIEALQNQVPGHRFAGFLIVNYGEPAYQFLVEQGENGVMQLLQSAPDVWGKVQRFGQHVPKFLAEFLDAPAAIQQAAMIRSGQQRQPPPAARPANQARHVVVDAVPETPRGGGRTIINPDGGQVKTKPNGPVVPESA